MSLHWSLEVLIKEGPVNFVPVVSPAAPEAHFAKSQFFLWFEFLFLAAIAAVTFSLRVIYPSISCARGRAAAFRVKKL